MSVPTNSQARCSPTIDFGRHPPTFAGATMGQIIGAALPFLAWAMITVALIAIFPDIALYLTRIG